MAGLVDVAWLVAGLLWYLLLVAAAVLVGLGFPAYVGKLAYDRARTEELSHPATVAVGAAFFAVLIAGFIAGTVLVYVG